jgi:hypothetical protein
VQGTDSDGDADGSSSVSTQAQPAHHHHHGGGGGQFFSKLQAAVTSALQSAQSDGSSTDPNQIVQNAIESVLKGDSSSGGSTTQDSAQASTDSSAPVDPQAAREQFFQQLQSYGINAQQFHQDFMSAIHDAKNGNSDPGSVFQSLPPGSAIDTTG